MTDIFSNRRLRADNPLRLALATRILTMPEQPLPPAVAPEPTVLAGKVLFVPVSWTTVDQCGAAKRFADERELDLVLIDSTIAESAERHTFTLGIGFYRQRTWRYGCALWRPADGMASCFVPHDRDDPTFYRVRDDILFCEEGRPWTNRADREHGFYLAQSGLNRLIGGR